MANYGYSTPFQGFQQGLPAGYMQAATDPGRNIAAGIDQFGDSLANALSKYQDRKDDSDFVQQKIQNSLSIALSAIQSGSIMDPNTHESQLLRTIMGITKTKDPEKLLEFAADTPGLALGKKKALAHDLEFGLKRYYDSKDKQAMDDYRNVVTQQVQQEMGQKAAGIEAEKAMLNVPLATEKTVETYNPDQIVSVYEDGKLVAGPGDKLAGDTPWDSRSEVVKSPKTYSQAFLDVARSFADKGVPVPQDKIHDYLSTQGIKPELPQGMVQTGAIRKGIGGTEEFRNVDAETEAAILVANAKNRGNPLNENQARAVVYARAMTANEDVLKGMEKGDFTGTGTWDKVPNFELWKKDPRKIFESSKYAWIDALARFRSGAGVRPDEYDNYDKTFMPQPGDDKKAIEHKRKLREGEFKSLQLVAGPSAVGMIGGADDGKKRFKFNPVTGHLE